MKDRDVYGNDVPLRQFELRRADLATLRLILAQAQYHANSEAGTPWPLSSAETATLQRLRDIFA